MIRLNGIFRIRYLKPIFVVLVMFLLWALFSEKPPLKVVIVGGDGMQGVERRGRVMEEGQGCTIPKLEQNGLELMKFIEKTKPLNCLKMAEENWVTIDNNGKLRLRKDRKGVKCTLAYFDAKNDDENKVLVALTLVDGQKMNHDFAKVYCVYKRWEWDGLLMSVVKREETLDKIKAKSSSQKSKIDRLSVVIFGFDSMSQQHFRRKMPATIKKLNEMGAVIFNGYNIVGDGTPAAFIPILTGKTELELPNTRKRFKDAKFVDEAYPFIWTNFSKAGYATLYGEDSYAIGTFTYRLKGFQHSPTDHYTRPFFKELELEEKKNTLISSPFTSDIIRCLGSEPLHKQWFRYSQEFLREYKDVDRFLLMHQSLLSHDDINLIEVEDTDFVNSLESMEKEGLLDDAVVFVMADHGHRFSKIRYTQQGQLEERLPMFSVRLPPKFRKTELGKKMQANLERNKDVLTTPFDVHATLMNILKLPTDVETEQDTKKRSLSLLRPIPKNRNCAQAGVEAHWCTCLNWQNASATEEDKAQTMRIANGLVAAINSRLSNVTDLCAKVTLASVIIAEKFVPNDGLIKYKNVKDKDGYEPLFEGEATASFAHYKMKITTNPNSAVYEATMFFHGPRNELEVDMTSISHVNPYGDDPHCIIDAQYSLGPFCVCHDRVRIK